MSYLAQSLRNAYEQRDRDALERVLRQVEALEKRQHAPNPHTEPAAEDAALIEGK